MLIAGTSLRLSISELIDHVRFLLPVMADGRFEVFNKTIRPMIILTDAQSSYYTIEDGIEGSHSIRVAKFARRIGMVLGLTHDEILTLECSALFHDVGKLLVERDLFLKKKRLNDDEYRKIQFHVSAGVSIIYQFEYLNSIIPGAYDHHERWDGSGYPNKKKGEGISLDGRILSLADAYDAITTPRPYRKPLGIEKAREEIEENSGTQFDPEIAEIFLRKL